MVRLKSLECKDEEDVCETAENPIPKAYDVSVMEDIFDDVRAEVDMPLNKDWAKQYIIRQYQEQLKKVQEIQIKGLNKNQR